MYTPKRAQGMPINVIILAALGLVVLIILAILFAGKTKTFSSNLESCKAKFGTCQYKAAECQTKGGSQLTGTDCDAKNTNKDTPEDQKFVCCITTFSS